MLQDIEELLAISGIDMMEGFISAGVHLDEIMMNLNVYLPEDRALFVWTGTMRAGKGYVT